MKLNMTWGDLARAAGGRLLAGSPEEIFDSFLTDTRALKDGQALWVLRGEHHDAHAFLNADLAKKSSGWIIEESSLLSLQSLLPRQVLVVPNTLKALQSLAAHHRKKFDIPVIGITGSNGKTTTKEMLKSILSRLGSVCASPGNWNNQIGVPLSVLNLEPSHRWAIFELADSHPGDIREVAQIAQPTLAILTNIGPDHLEFYGTIEANFKTKLELLEHIPQDGRVVINGDDPWLASLEGRLGSRAISFGTDPLCRVRFSENEIVFDRHKITVHLKALGTLSRYNAAAAAAGAWALGIDPETIRLGLEDYRPSLMRMELFQRPSGSEILLDAYNANPASMRAAIESFFEAFPTRKKILVLGDMKELGERSALFHGELGEWLANLNASAVYLAGPEIKPAALELEKRKPPYPVCYATSPEEWIEDLKKRIDKNCAIFIKASRAMKFENVFAALSETPGK